MNNRCNFPDCFEKVAFSCSCLTENNFFCVKHSTKHMKSGGGSHELSTTKIKLSNYENAKIAKKAEKNIKWLQELRKNLFINADQIINLINSALQNSLSIIKKQETCLIKLLYIRALRNKSLDKETYEYILHKSLEKTKFNFNQFEDIKTCLN